MIVPGCAVRKKESFRVELVTGVKRRLQIVPPKIFNQMLERHEHKTGVKTIDPSLRLSFTVRPRAVASLTLHGKAHGIFGCLAILFCAGFRISARQQLRRQQVHIVNLRMIERRVAEAMPCA